MFFKLFELSLKLSILLPQHNIFPDLWIDIFCRNIANITCHACIGQGLKRFLKMSHSRIETCYHQAVRISSDWLLEQRCQFAVSVRRKKVGLSWGGSFIQWSYDLPKSKQTFVDLDAFLEDDSCRFSGFVSFTSSKINNFKFALNLFRWVFQQVTLDPKSQQTMWSAWGVIHFMRTHDLIFLTFVPPLQSLINRPALPFKHILDSKLLHFVPPHLKRPSIARIDQIVNSFVINLNEWNEYFMSFVWSRLFINYSE